MGNILYFYIFKNNELKILECKRMSVDKYYLDNGKTRTRDEEKHPINVAYGSTKEIIMFSNAKNNIDEFFRTGIAFVNKQLSKYKRQFDRLDYDKENDKIKKLEIIIGTYHGILKDMFAYELDNLKTQ